MELVLAVVAVFMLYATFLYFRSAINALETGDSFVLAVISSLLFAVSGSFTGGIAFTLLVYAATHGTLVTS